MSASHPTFAEEFPHLTRIGKGLIADASQMSGADFLRALQGKPPLTEADRIAKRQAEEAYWAEYRKQARAELEQLRDRLCALASLELAAEWRAKWAIEDSEAEQREQLRAA